MWRFVSGTQRGASFNWHTNCCNTRTHTRHTMFPDRRHRKRAASNVLIHIEKVHSHMQTDIFWSDRHRKASSLTHTQYIDVCRCGKTCDTHTQTRACKHIQIFTLADASLARSTTADFILNVTPPSWLELTIIFGLNEFVVLLICRFPTRSLKTHRASN